MASDESGINEALFGEVDEKLKKSPLFQNRKKDISGGDHSTGKRRVRIR